MYYVGSTIIIYRCCGLDGLDSFADLLFIQVLFCVPSEFFFIAIQIRV